MPFYLDLAIKIIIPIITFFLGSYFSVWNDRRKEFNAIATPIFERITKHISQVRSGNRPQDPFKETDFSSLSQRLSVKEVESLMTAINKYSEADKNCGVYVKGYWEFNNGEPLEKALFELSRFVKAR